MSYLHRCLAYLSLLLLLPGGHAAAQMTTAPAVIPFQGFLTSQAGQPVPDGKYNRIFNLYAEAVRPASGGQPLWSERHASVGVTNGQVNVFLGSQPGNPASLASLDFSVVFNLFEEAFMNQQALLVTESTATQRTRMAEIVNELLQGQSLRGFQTMIDALRMRYPRITDQGAPRLPAPAGAREETAALETAALDFQQPLQYAAYAIRAYGPSVLRAGTPAGQTPFNPAFPQYVTFTDETLSGQRDRPTPIPVKNEYRQLAVAAGGQGQTRGYDVPLTATPAVA